jgi:hypothetical protein
MGVIPERDTTVDNDASSVVLRCSECDFETLSLKEADAHEHDNEGHRVNVA